MRVSPRSGILASCFVLLAACGGTGAAPQAPKPHTGTTEVALLAGGCFWCIEAAFDGVPGVIDAVSGYSGGKKPNPTYEEVGTGDTGHREAIRVTFDPSKITYAQILDIYWRQIDPTDDGGQFADRGDQYRTAIYVSGPEQRRIAEASKAVVAKNPKFKKPIVTEIVAAGAFYPAEGYHQDYSSKQPAHYKAYKWGSGRQSYIEETWKGEPPIVVGSPAPASTDGTRFTKPSDAELKKKLTPMQYACTQEDATERPFANEYWDNHEPGIYVDVATGEPLFSSTDKFDSGTGWPSFTKPIAPGNVVQKENQGAGYLAAEVRSQSGDSHLGHVFDDGPEDAGGLRYCINSAALRFIPVSRLEAEGYGQYRKLFPSEPQR